MGAFTNYIPAHTDIYFHWDMMHWGAIYMFRSHCQSRRSWRAVSSPIAASCKLHYLGLQDPLIPRSFTLFSAQFRPKYPSRSSPSQSLRANQIWTCVLPGLYCWFIIGRSVEKRLYKGKSFPKFKKMTKYTPWNIVRPIWRIFSGRVKKGEPFVTRSTSTAINGSDKIASGKMSASSVIDILRIPKSPCSRTRR